MRPSDITDGIHRVNRGLSRRRLMASMRPSDITDGIAKVFAGMAFATRPLQ